MIDPTLLDELTDVAIHVGTDSGGNPHYRVGPGDTPQPLLRDLRYAARDEQVTVWHSPRYRAILMASQSAGEIVLYQTQTQYDTALQAARLDVYPTLERQR